MILEKSFKHQIEKLALESGVVTKVLRFAREQRKIQSGLVIGLRLSGYGAVDNVRSINQNNSVPEGNLAAFLNNNGVIDLISKDGTKILEYGKLFVLMRTAIHNTQMNPSIVLLC